MVILSILLLQGIADFVFLQFTGQFNHNDNADGSQVSWKESGDAK